ncbi:ras-related protein Rab-9A-like isoform X2 [Neocloeon triangulifer]|uniref:ras-related protein Rab-9A-like isoform X2 n=1 Tax=Neocloeon triangulifer TaxID=2078957 RepID=UPI00286F5C34|nr:ras-related protein Rab-9A-like isoform X2 [Neocloeon triangulifer]
MSVTSGDKKQFDGRLLKVVILGDMGVGKTCLMRRLVYDQFDLYAFHTIGVEFLTKEIEDDDHNSYTLQIWDTAGQEKFRSLRTPFYRGADLCMLTYSLIDRHSFQNLSYWRKEFLFHARPKDNFPFIVVGTKLDLADVHTRDVPEDWAELWCQQNAVQFHTETSSKTSANVEKAFLMALDAWKRSNASDQLANLSFRKMELQPDDLVRIGVRSQRRKITKKCCFF